MDAPSAHDPAVIEVIRQSCHRHARLRTKQGVPNMEDGTHLGDAWLRVHGMIHRWDPQKSKISYLATTARGAAMDQDRTECEIKSKRRWGYKEGSLDRERTESGASMHNLLVCHDPESPMLQDDAFEDLVRPLRPRDKKLLRMYYVDQMRQKDIAKLLGVGDCRVSQMIADAINELRASIQNGANDRKTAACAA
jgi:RNA polymerase sigma factor (sigma-70 family)